MTDVIELKILIKRFFFLELDNSKKKSHLYENTHGPMYRVKRRRKLDDIEAKVDFLKHLDEDTVVELLRAKVKLSRNSGFLTREYDMISNLRNNFC